MNLLENIKQKINQIRSDEQVLREEIEDNNSSAVEDSEKVLQEIEELDKEFIDLLTSGNAEETFNSAINIIEWERDLSNFLEDFSSKTTEIERALEGGNDELFFEKIDEIRSEIRELSSRVDQIDLDQTSEYAIYLLDNFGGLKKEFEWFEKVVETLDREERLLEKSRSDKELELENSEIDEIEKTIPRLESQISDLRELAQKHKKSKLRADDFEFDTNLDELKSLKPRSDKKKKKLQELISLIEQLKEIAKTNKKDPSRRDYLRMAALATSTVTGSFFAKEATEYYPDLGIPSSKRGKWSRKDTQDLNGLKLGYVVKGKGSKADVILDFQNTSEEIIKVEAAVEIPKSWNEKSEEMKFEEVSNMSDQMSKKFRLVPSKQKNLELTISEIADDSRGSIHLKVAWGVSKDNLQEKTIPIDMVS